MIPTVKTKRLFIVIIILNIIMLAFYVFVSIKIENKKSNISILASEFGLKIEKEERLKSSREIIRNISDKQEKLNACFIEKDGIVTFIEYIESIAETSKVDLNIISVGINDEEITNSSGFFEELELNFEVKGLWKEEFYFLLLLESSPYHIDIERMVLSNVAKQGENSEFWMGMFSIKAIKKIN